MSRAEPRVPLPEKDCRTEKTVAFLIRSSGERGSREVPVRRVSRQRLRQLSPASLRFRGEPEAAVVECRVARVSSRAVARLIDEKKRVAVRKKSVCVREGTMLAAKFSQPVFSRDGSDVDRILTLCHEPGGHETPSLDRAHAAVSCRVHARDSAR